ncbi:ribosome-binding factor A [bacterium]|jgi:ribosome-binding factor A|nr:ribosome-binding factor A [bacterium]MBT5014970.1 ribosome-binding factor A [bacterium]
MHSSVSDIKRKQKEALLLKEISTLFLDVSLEYPAFQSLFINKVLLSPDKGLCSVYFYSPKGIEFFKEQLPQLKLFKPSLRKALSQRIRSRRIPQIVFVFDSQLEKQETVESLLDKIKTTEDN